MNIRWKLVVHTYAIFINSYKLVFCGWDLVAFPSWHVQKRDNRCVQKIVSLPVVFELFSRVENSLQIICLWKSIVFIYNFKWYFLLLHEKLFLMWLFKNIPIVVRAVRHPNKETNDETNFTTRLDKTTMTLTVKMLRNVFVFFVNRNLPSKSLLKRRFCVYYEISLWTEKTLICKCNLLLWNYYAFAIWMYMYIW